MHKEGSVFMYDINKTVSTIKATAKEQNVSITTMLEEIGINKNTLSSMKSRGSWVSSDTLAKIADYLGVSVDYLLGRQIKNSTPDDIRSAIISKVYAMSDEQAKKLLDLLESLVSE